MDVGDSNYSLGHFYLPITLFAGSKIPMMNVVNTKRDISSSYFVSFYFDYRSVLEHSQLLKWFSDIISILPFDDNR